MSTALLARDAGLSVNGMILSHAAGDESWVLTLRLAGTTAAVERSRRDIESLTAGRGFNVIDADASSWASTLDGMRDARLRVRGGVVPTKLITLLDELMRLNANVVAYPTAGIAYGCWPGEADVANDALLALRNAFAAVGGALVLEAAPVETKRAVDVWGDAGAALDLMRRVKAEFDPRNVLSPGRFVGGL